MNTLAWLTLLLLLGQEPNPVRIQTWAEMYAPIVIHDSREIAPLTSIQQLMQLNPSLEADCDNGYSEKQTVNQAGFWNFAELQQAYLHCKKNLALSFSGRIPPSDPVAYYQVQAEGRYLSLQYWFFYAWNATDHLGGGALIAACGNHEGDWEHISIRLDRDLLFRASTTQEFLDAIDDVYLAQHKRQQHQEIKYYRPNDPMLTFEGSHLNVFSALGSHASYPHAGKWPLMTIAGMTLNDVNDGAGLKMDLSKARLEPVMHQDWFTFPGRWGGMRDAGCNWLEQISSTSNDGSYGPGHAHKVAPFYQGDWYDYQRPTRKR